MKLMVYVEAAKVCGGIEIFAQRHVAELRAAGNETAVYSALPEGEAFDFSAFDEIIVHKCSDVATLKLFPPEKTTYYVHDHEPICPRTMAYTPLGRNCDRPGALWPCIFCAPVCRNWRPALRRVFEQGRRKEIMAEFKRIVVISGFMKSRLVANGFDPMRIEVRPPAVNVKASPNSGICGVELLYVGQLVRGKGVQLLLEAMTRIKRPLTLDIVGTGNMEEKLKAMARTLGLNERVRFHGFQKTPQDWMAAAKCVVVPSFWQEPYGLVAAEAVALGRKVVAFAIGGLPEACGGKAVMVPPGDVGALAKAIDGLEL